MRKYLILAACLALIVAGVFSYISTRDTQHQKAPGEMPPIEKKARIEIPPEKVVDYGKLDEDTDTELNTLMKERKAPYGVDKSIDMIVKSDESIRIGNKTIRMEKILDDLKLKQGEILEKDVEGGTTRKDRNEYGIHVVRPEDNIWNIHFRLLKEYYNHKGIQVSPLADEPNRRGRSSGVGKILKFSEHMVHIYNVKEDKLEMNLDQIYPLSKIIIYNMTYIFALLDRINYKTVHRIEFDGETLWLPAEQ
jgi:hypothetical protein